MRNRLSRRRLASRCKGFWLRSAIVGHRQELSNIDRQRSGQPVEKVDGRIETLALDVADGAAIDCRINCQMFLADSAFGANPTKIPGNARATSHARQSIKLQQIIPSDISDAILCRRQERIVLARLLRYAALPAFTLALSLSANAQEGLNQPIDLESQPSSTVGSSTASTRAYPYVENLALLEGWYEFEGDNGCSIPDPDNQWRVVVGRMELGDSGVVLGQGTPQFRMYDQGCDLSDIVDVGSGFTANAVCQTEDGATIEGNASFFPDPAQGLTVTSPLGRLQLNRCTAYVVAQINQETGQRPQAEAAIEANKPFAATNSNAASETHNLGDVTTMTDALEGTWHLDGQCGPDASPIFLSRDTLADFANGLSNTLRLRMENDACYLERPVVSGGQLQWEARCSPSNGMASASLSLADDGELMIETPIVSGALTDCATIVTAETAPAPLLPPDEPEAVPPSGLGSSKWQVIPVAGETGDDLMPEAQRNVIAQVYRDYCDPNFGALYDFSGPVATELYEPYRNQLLVAYRSNCHHFLGQQVINPLGVQVVDRLVELPSGPSRLDHHAAIVLGILLFAKTHHGPDICWGDQGDALFVEYFGELPDQLLELASQANLATIGAGYASGWGQWFASSLQRAVPYCALLGIKLESEVPALISLSQNFAQSAR